MTSHENPEERRGLRARLTSGKTLRTRNVIAATGILAIGVTATGVAATGSPLLQGKRNGTATAETQVIANIPASSSATGGYSTRQSNLSNSGGGAVYGCRSTAGGSAAVPPKNPCLRVNNLSSGFAFEFNASDGLSAGLITVGKGGDSTKPFTTNATGVATGLNADRVDGLNGTDIAADAKAKADAAQAAAATDATTKANAAKDRWVLIGSDGTIVKQSGGFSLINCYQANGNCYIDAGSDVTNKMVSSEIVTTNGANDAGKPTELSGDSSAAPCGLDIVTCAPTGAESNNVFVVTPRNSDGTAVDTAGGQKNYFFYARVSAASAG